MYIHTNHVQEQEQERIQQSIYQSQIFRKDSKKTERKKKYNNQSINLKSSERIAKNHSGHDDPDRAYRSVCPRESAETEDRSTSPPAGRLGMAEVTEVLP